MSLGILSFDEMSYDVVFFDVVIGRKTVDNMSLGNMLLDIVSLDAWTWSHYQPRLKASLDDRNNFECSFLRLKGLKTRVERCYDTQHDIQPSDTQHNDNQHNGTLYCFAECLCRVSFMLSVVAPVELLARDKHFGQRQWRRIKVVYNIDTKLERTSPETRLKESEWKYNHCKQRGPLYSHCVRD